LNRRRSISAKQSEMNYELKHFDKLSIAGKREAFKDIFLDYYELNEERKNSDTKLYNSKRKRHISNNHVAHKKKLSPALRTKAHSAMAAGIISVIGSVPWDIILGGRTLAILRPIFLNEVTISWGNTILTWVLSELDHRKRK
jgi:hypothetical protein